MLCMLQDQENSTLFKQVAVPDGFPTTYQQECIQQAVNEANDEYRNLLGPDTVLLRP